MSNKEQIMKLLDKVPDYKMGYDIVKISWHIFLKDITDYAATSKVS